MPGGSTVARPRRFAQTMDRVEVSDGLRVWALPDLEPGTVDLGTPMAPARSGGWLLMLHRDGGGSGMVANTTITSRHPATTEPPRPLGSCQWVGTCAVRAVRMQAHPLMSPVPVCRTCGPQPRS